MHNINELIAHLEEIQKGTRRLSPLVKVQICRVLSADCDGCLHTRTSQLVNGPSEDIWTYIPQPYWKQSESERFDLPYAHAVVVAGLLNDKLIGPAIDYLNDVLNGVPV